MPQILVVTESPEEAGRTVVYRERIAPSDLESDHFSGQLVERVGWAVQDADEMEHDVAEPRIPLSPGPVRAPDLGHRTAASAR
jgi:hypothetical protein